MNDNDFISIILPIYQVEKYLRRCLDSILAQTYSHYEVIAVDDGSTDGCSEILAEYAQADSRFRVIRQKNAGVSVARNRGLKEATGDYIAFIDSDDAVHSRYLELLVPAALQQESDIVIGDFRFIALGDKPPEQSLNSLSAAVDMTNEEALAQLYGKQRCRYSACCGKLHARHLFDVLSFPAVSSLAGAGSSGD